MATLDLVTLEEAQGALNIDTSDTTHDTALTAYITAVSLRLDELCGPIVVRTITGETHDGGNHQIWLDYIPISSVTTVTEYANTTATTLTAETNATKPSSAYMVDLQTGKLVRRSSNGNTTFAKGMQNIAVTYVAGRATQTSTVSEKFKLAANLMLAAIWRREQGAGTTTFGEFASPVMGATFAIPNAVMELLADEIRGPVVL